MANMAGMATEQTISVRRVSSDLWRRFKAAAVRLGIPVRRALAEACEDWLAKKGE